MRDYFMYIGTTCKMAAPLLSGVSKSLNKSIYLPISSVLSASTPVYQPSCGKKTKASAVSKNPRGPVPGKRRGPKKHEGEFAYKGEILAKQYGLTLYPGENVGITKNNTLYALRDGVVVVSCEQLNPYPDSPLYERVQKGMVIHKKFWNIYPTPVHAKFKLVSET